MKTLPFIPENLLVVRADRIGDLVLSTPVFSALRFYLPKTKITALVSPEASDVLRKSGLVDDIIEFDTRRRFRGLSGARKMGLILSTKGFDATLVLQTNLSVAVAIRSSGIKHRIGPRTHIHSLLAYNYGFRQHRSRVEMHEAQYNLQLLKSLGIEPFEQRWEISMGNPTPEQEQTIEDFLTKRQFPERPLIGIHPGMGGSALNWPVEYYADLVQTLSAKNLVEICLTGGPSEKKLLEEIARRAGLSPLMYLGQGGLGAFASLVKRFRGFIAPSTGPLHVAAAVKTPVITLFPPIKVQSALRWGPYVQDPSLATVLTPEVNCGEVFRCAGKKCPYYFCMRSIYPQDVLEHVLRLVT